MNVYSRQTFFKLVTVRNAINYKQLMEKRRKKERKTKEKVKKVNS